jgi:archaellum component FlaF (FlaF/FlaG flagellin family)
MESVLTTLFTAIIVIISMVTMVVSSLNSANMVSDSFRDIEERISAERGTSIDITEAEVIEEQVFISVTNDGNYKLGQFDKWTVLLEAQNGVTHYVQHVEGTFPGDGEWAVQEIVLPNGSPEVFDPGILNPWETMVLVLNVPAIFQAGFAARPIITTPNGVTCQCLITWQ